MGISRKSEGCCLSPYMHSTAPMTKNPLAPNVNSAEAEKLPSGIKALELP